MALGAIVNVNNANLPEDFELDAEPAATSTSRTFELLDLERKYGNLTLTYAMQIHACVLEIDPETGVYEVVDYAVIDDCGNRINPQIVEGQVMGAIAHAIGAATCETFTYDEDGNLLTPNFYDYHVPPRDRHAAAQDGRDRVALAVLPARDEGDGRGRRRRHPRRLRRDSRTRCARSAAASSTTPTTPTTASSRS